MKTCNPKNNKANDPHYECNSKTGRWIKTRSTAPPKVKTSTAPPKVKKVTAPPKVKKVTDHDTRGICQTRLLKEFGIKIPKNKIYVQRELVEKNMADSRIKHELVHYESCYFHFTYIPIKNLSIDNDLWKHVKSYRELYEVALRFMTLFPPLYHLPQGLTYQQRFSRFHEIQQNKDILKYFQQILASFVKTFERLPESSLPPTPSQGHALSSQLQSRGILPYRSFTLQQSTIPTQKVIKIVNRFHK